MKSKKSSGMGSLLNLKIGHKLLAGGILMLVISLLIVALGQIGMAKINNEVRKMYDQRLLPAAEFIELKTDLMESRALRQMSCIEQRRCLLRSCVSQFSGALLLFSCRLRLFFPESAFQMTCALRN